jgi:undecaprenyl pyrophosphate phosphatase UppP
MLGASLLKLVKFGFAFTRAEGAVLLTGMLTAFLVSVLAIKFLLGYIRKNDFKACRVVPDRAGAYGSLVFFHEAWGLP